ncbi:MAG: sugar-transfer associated ATP-grasp domain-containing protein, partial [Thalassolituus sp.]
MWSFIAPWTLASRGILGMNKRNRNYIARYNPRSLFPLVDNKRITRATLSEAGIPMTELLGVAETQSQISSVIRMLSERQSFAIKPAKGSGGKGIMVIAGRDGDTWIKTSGGRVTREDLERHISNILSGLYSLGGAADVALIEDLIVPSDV